MQRKRALLALVAALSAIAAFIFAATASAGNNVRAISSSGTTQIRSTPTGEGAGGPELNPNLEAAVDGGPIVNRNRPGGKNGKFPHKPLDVPVVGSASVAASNPGLDLTFAGLNHRDQRTANSGNQFSLEPPDQGLCVANGYTLEVVNDVMRVYNTSGAPLTTVTDLNTFYGYPAQFVRPAGPFGPFVTDPTCMYDPGARRWFVQVLTIDQDATTGAFTGLNHIDLAISDTPSPLGSWTIYKIPAQDDGTAGTPNHHCDTGPDASDPAVTNPTACLGDYPKIGADANGIYLQTNEYSLFGVDPTSPGYYTGSQIYAIGKQQLSGVTLPASINLVLIENTTVDGSKGFTVWPASSPPGQYSTEKNGTEYFLSTIAGDGSETGNPTGTARRIGLWALTNTASLNSGSPNVQLSSRLINSETYVVPDNANQKTGPFPLGQCINDTTLPTIFGPGCWELLFVAEPGHNESEEPPSANDSRIQGVWYTNGVLWGAADTQVKVGGSEKAGVAWFSVAPKINGASKVEGKIKKQGYLALAGNNLTYPAIAIRPDGKGIMAFTALGSDYFPSAGYAQIDANAGTVGDVHIPSPGLGPEDGFSGYAAFGRTPNQTRWGDYGWATVDGSHLWFASESIEQGPCTLTGAGQYYPFPPSTAGFGSCGSTRTSLGNWGTRISELTP